MEKVNHFYIDETGHLGNNSGFFIHGCIKTDSPDILENALSELKQELYDDLYFDNFSSEIKENGFHAVDNHPDVRTHLYKLLPLLDYRAYFVILDKTTEYYNRLTKEKQEYEIFEFSIRKLLKDRILKNKNDKNIFYFEQIDIKKKSLSAILDDFFSSIDPTFDCEYYIVDKNNQNMAIIDYLNYILNQVIKNKQNNPMKKAKKPDSWELKFNMINTKIGVINILHNKKFLSRKKKSHETVEYKNLIENFGE